MSYQDLPGDLSPDPTEVPIPRGSAQYSWLWIVSIIIIVGLALYFLQRQLPEQSTPSSGLEAPTVITPTSAVPLGPAGISRIVAPNAADAESYVGIDWDITAPVATTATHASIHWGTESQANAPAGETTAPADLSYAHVSTEYASGSFAIPGSFETNLRTPIGGTIYFRAHAVIDGKNYWSAEQKIEVKGK